MTYHTEAEAVAEGGGALPQGLPRARQQRCVARIQKGVPPYAHLVDTLPWQREVQCRSERGVQVAPQVVHFPGAGPRSCCGALRTTAAVAAALWTQVGTESLAVELVAISPPFA